MRHHPEPEATPDGPAYQGRLLDRVDEPVVDQGAPFDVRTLITRRGMLAVLGIGVGAAALAACTPEGASTATTGSASTSDGEIPEETAGPYPGDGSNGPDVLEESGIVRSDIRSSIDGGATAVGVPLVFTLALADMLNDDAPFEGLAVYVWHCDAQGGYSMYSEGLEDETYLRGVQVTGADGTVTFTSIYPGCYTGRWPHIHFEVYPDTSSIADSSTAIATSQLAFPQDACELVYADDRYSGSAQNLAGVSLATDNVFGDDGGALQLATLTGDPAAGYTATLPVRIDTSTAAGAGMMSGGGGMPGGGPSGQPPR
ncbi:intradiol ring-cleavage dioxygenase [Protaetiibacter mangrovi]|uniref:Intradiol ring-cleavage dioxygenase n=1 Tax=Protaetiibacter mangrovi TaxID=2970926 RepID=A0ABT1ZCN0_9MICO|nr:intradiol ring-cleavage dioxygenase [Protaetiibacter mangrovi]MCS0498465.1 intradiol ring-cleavage dioxygenase [Protaetiibacter mangrovi]